MPEAVEALEDVETLFRSHAHYMDELGRDPKAVAQVFREAAESLAAEELNRDTPHAKNPN